MGTTVVAANVEKYKQMNKNRQEKNNKNSNNNTSRDRTYSMAHSFISISSTGSGINGNSKHAVGKRGVYTKHLTGNLMPNIHELYLS